ncbi:hypothetical protein [Streptomyces sp. NPDC055992]|uniref:hypothetical protein n=1 Tax=Streptomyces sp. NPDC055992 TaxID=3345673 RepID=UPI0035D85600
MVLDELVTVGWSGRWWAPAGFVGAASVWGGARWWWLRRARTLLLDRVVVALVPAAGFDPSLEEIDRHAARLARVPAVVGWAPRRAMGVRVRLSSSESQLSYQLEGPAQAASVLQLQAFADVNVVDPYASHEVPRIRFEGVPPLPRQNAGGRESA